jgi:hypothetical protein
MRWIMYQRRNETKELSSSGYRQHNIDCCIKHYTKTTNLVFGANASYSQLNLFPAKEGISLLSSPGTILGLPALDYAKYCVVPFGAYVRDNHKTIQASSDVEWILRMMETRTHTLCAKNFQIATFRADCLPGIQKNHPAIILVRISIQATTWSISEVKNDNPVMLSRQHFGVFFLQSGQIHSGQHNNLGKSKQSGQQTPPFPNQNTI